MGLQNLSVSCTSLVILVLVNSMGHRFWTPLILISFMIEFNRSLLGEDEFHTLADSTIHDLQEKFEVIAP